MKAFVFARPSSPQFLGQEFGHVGWGFQISETEYIVGAVENTKGLPINPPKNMDFWYKQTTEPLKDFSIGPMGNSTRYDVYKEFTVVNPDIENAFLTMEWVSRQPYNVKNRNCMHSVYSILQSYGATNLPDPYKFENTAPVMWFRKIGVPQKVLMDTKAQIDVAIYEHPEMEGSVKRFIGSEGIKLTDLSSEKIGFTISSIVVKKGNVKAFNRLNQQGNKLELNGPVFKDFLDEWDNSILSMEILPEANYAFDNVNSFQQPIVFDLLAPMEVFNTNIIKKNNAADEIAEATENLSRKFIQKEQSI